MQDLTAGSIARHLFKTTSYMLVTVRLNFEVAPAVAKLPETVSVG